MAAAVLLCVLVSAWCGIAAAAPAGGAWVIEPGHEAYFAANVDVEAAERCGWTPSGVQIQGSRVRYGFEHEGGLRAAVLLAHPSTCAEPVRGPGAAFCVDLAGGQGAQRDAPGEAAGLGACGPARLRDMVAGRVVENGLPFAWSEPAAPSPPGPLAAIELESVRQWAEDGMQALLLLYLIVAGALTSMRSRLGGVRPGEWSTLGLLVAAGLAYRLALEPMPADMNLAIEQGFGRTGHNWAPGFSLCMRALFAVAPPTLETAAVASAVVSSFTALLAFGLTVVLFESRTAGLAAAAGVALHPILVRFGASDTPHVLASFAILAGFLFTAQWARHGGRGRALQAAGWIGFAANVRFELVIYAAAMVLVAAAALRRRGPATLRQAAVGLLLAGAYGLSPALTSIDYVSSFPGGNAGWNALVEGIVVRSPDSPWLFLVAAVAGVVALLWRRESRRAVLLFAAAIFVGGLVTRAGRETDHRYVLPVLCSLAVPAGVGLDAVARLAAQLSRRVVDAGPRPMTRLAAVAGRPARVAAVVGLAVLCCWPTSDIATRTWTVQRELAFVRRHIPAIPDDCTVVHRRCHQCDAGLNLAAYLSVEAGRRHRWVELGDLLASPGLDACTVFYQNASCHADFSRCRDRDVPDCAEVAARFELTTIAEARLPARSFVGERYLLDPVPVGFYRLGERAEPPADRSPVLGAAAGAP